MQFLNFLLLFFFIILQSNLEEQDTVYVNKETLTETETYQQQLEYINSNSRSTPEKSKKAAIRLLNEVKNKQEPHIEALILNTLSRTEYFLGNLAEALDYAFMALEKYESLDGAYVFEISAVNNNMANIYLEIGDQTKALEYYLLALEKYDPEINPRNAGVLLGNIGNLYLDIGQNLKSIEYYQKAIALFEPIKYFKGLAIQNNNIGEAWLGLKKYDTAFFHYQKASVLYDSLNDKRGIALVLNNIGYLYQQQGKPDEALNYLKKSLTQQNEIGTIIGMAETMSNLGALYLELGNNDSSAFYLDQAQQIGKSTGSLKILEQNARNMSNLFYVKGDYREALKWHKTFKTLSDSVILANSDHLLTEMQTKYETEQKEKEINLLKQENEIRALEQEKANQLRNFFIFSLLFILILIYAVFSIRNSKIAKKMGELERIALRAQMKPHFIFNALSSIQTFILENDLRNADRYLSKFAKLIRLILDSSKMPMILLEDELNMLNLYIEIEKMRLDNKFDVLINIDEKINPKKIRIASMLMQPFVENAIWHGFSPKDEKGILKIDISIEGDNLICIIEDNGVGRSQANLKFNKLPGHKSTGLKITEKRLDITHRNKFIKKQYFKIEDLYDNAKAIGTRVRITIPYKTN